MNFQDNWHLVSYVVSTMLKKYPMTRRKNTTKSLSSPIFGAPNFHIQTIGQESPQFLFRRLKEQETSLIGCHKISTVTKHPSHWMETLWHLRAHCFKEKLYHEFEGQIVLVLERKCLPRITILKADQDNFNGQYRACSLKKCDLMTWLPDKIFAGLFAMPLPKGLNLLKNRLPETFDW